MLLIKKELLKIPLPTVLSESSPVHPFSGAKMTEISGAWLTCDVYKSFMTNRPSFVYFL
jgi:hypothetical protein